MHFLHQFQNHWSSWDLNSSIIMARPSFTQLMVIFSHVYWTERLAVQEYILPFKFLKYIKLVWMSYMNRKWRKTNMFYSQPFRATVMPWKIKSNSDTVYLTVSFPSMYCIKHIQWLILYSAHQGSLIWPSVKGITSSALPWVEHDWYSITSVALLGNWKYVY